MAVKTIVVKGRQTLWDIAIQEYGSIEGVEQLIADNPGLVDYESNLVAGTLLKVKSDAVDKDVVDFFTKNELEPISALDGENNTGGDFNNDFNNDFN